jgi:hypothetical protein
MTTRAQTCTARRSSGPEPCRGEIRPSYIAPEPIISAKAHQGHVTHPASCLACGKVYADVVSVTMTREDFAMVGDRMSPSSRQELQATATERPSEGYDVELTEDRARDFASKAANLGLAAMAHKIRQELNGLTIQRRQRTPA